MDKEETYLKWKTDEEEPHCSVSEKSIRSTTVIRPQAIIHAHAHAHKLVWSQRTEQRLQNEPHPSNCHCQHFSVSIKHELDVVNHFHNYDLKVCSTAVCRSPALKSSWLIQIKLVYFQNMAEGGVSLSVSARPIHSLEEQLSKFPAELLDSPCADAHLVKLSQSIAEWRDLSPYLRLSPAEERGILTAFPPATPARQRIDMLMTWRDKFGVDANYR